MMKRERLSFGRATKIAAADYVKCASNNHDDNNNRILSELESWLVSGLALVSECPRCT